MSTRIFYLAAIHPARDAGVANKIRSTVQALDNAGYSAHACLCEEDGLAGILSLRRRLKQLDAGLIIIRSCGYYGFLLLDRLIQKRLEGTKIVIDVPTPFVNALTEIWGQKISLSAGIVRVLLLFLSQPWSNLPAHRVIQYGAEHPWFSIGLRKKTILMGNGVTVSDLPLVSAVAWKRPNPITLIAVGKLSFWHGYDRVICGLAKYKKDLGVYWPPVQLLMIGDGPERKRLEALTASLGLAGAVRCLGRQDGHKLHDYYRCAHAVISSIGMHRTRLSIASPLKSREAIAMGLPIIYSYNDPDLPDDLVFAHRIPADDSPVDIHAIVDWYEDLRKNNIDPASLREYATRKLDVLNKIWVYTDLLESA